LLQERPDAGTGRGDGKLEDMSEQDSVAFWESRYGERDRIWSGEPNQPLVATVGELAPGRAVDLGCGEGGDSVWLAGRGWHVTAIDVSATAIARARELAARRQIPDGRITWVVEDLSGWKPSDGYELVSACFFQSPVEFARNAVLQRAASAVTPGGHLLVVSHAEPPPWAKSHDHGDHADHADHGGHGGHGDHGDHGDHAGHPHHSVSPAEELAGLQLDAAAWEILIAEIRSRDAVGPDGQRATLQDSIVFARRR
jgi:SAM-dependent methyltransferase